ncbi:hypothetical protein ACU4GD_31045 [Cupriavidus basilensis]
MAMTGEIPAQPSASSAKPLAVSRPCQHRMADMQIATKNWRYPMAYVAAQGLTESDARRASPHVSGAKDGGGEGRPAWCGQQAGAAARRHGHDR